MVRSVRTSQRARLTFRLSSSTAFYKGLMGIKSVTAVSETELHLEYDVSGQSIVLMLGSDAITRRLVDAQVSYRSVEIAQSLIISSTAAMQISRKRSTSHRQTTTSLASLQTCSSWSSAGNSRRSVNWASSVVFGLCA